MECLLLCHPRQHGLTRFLFIHFLQRSEGFFQCKSGDCVYDDGVCSGGAECPDGSDETAAVCSTHFCPEPAFRCDYGACILRMNRCDGKRDCIDGSDEKPELCSNVTAISSGFSFAPIVATPPTPVQAGRPNEGLQNLPSSATSAVNQMLSTMPTMGPSTTNRDALNIVSAYRRLLLRLELQILELQQENLRLRLNAFDGGIRDFPESPILDQSTIEGGASNFGLFEPISNSPGSGTTFNSPTNSPIRIPPAAAVGTPPTSPQRPILSNNELITPTTPGRVGGESTPTPAPPPISNEPREEGELLIIKIRVTMDSRGLTIKWLFHHHIGDCDAPVLQGGRVSDVYSRRYDGRFVKNGEMIIFECSAGTSLIGANSTYCIRGTLLNELPQCTSKFNYLPLRYRYLNSSL